MASKVLKILQERRAELLAINSTRQNWTRITEWHARTRPVIAQHFREQVKPFDELIRVRWVAFPRVIALSGRPTDTSKTDAAELAGNTKVAESAKEKLLAHMDALIELTDIEDEAKEPSVLERELGERVFLVHGHNERWLQECARLIEKLGLDVTILREQPNQGRTIIEKFEDHAAGDVGFAVILLTADDKGGPVDTGPKLYKLRARQNVILELGFFLSELGRSRVCALYEDGVEIPSDYSGVLFVRLDESGAWKTLLAREMKAAGMSIDLNKAV